MEEFFGSQHKNKNMRIIHTRSITALGPLDLGSRALSGPDIF